MEWKAGQVIRIKDYQFEDNNSKDKYAIILQVNNDKAYILHSLTTSQNNLGVQNLNHGCNVHHRHVPYYFIPANQEITDTKFYFDKDTFIFFLNNVREMTIEKLDKASKVLFGVIDLGVLVDDELKRIIKCALKSKFIPVALAKELKEE